MKGIIAWFAAMNFRVWARGRRGLAAGLLLAAAMVPRSIAQSAAETVPITGEPEVREWAPPVYPEAARLAKIEGRVLVEFVVGTDGHVIDATVKESPDERLNEAALAAVRQWIFAPALNDGKPEPCAMLVPVEFSLKAGKNAGKRLRPPFPPHVAPTTPAKPKKTPNPDYPAELVARKLPGVVMLGFEVDPTGRPDGIEVLQATDGAFVAAALQTLRRWQFEPARQGPLAVTGVKQSPMKFLVPDASKEDILAANGIRELDHILPGDVPPVVESLADPVYPREKLLAGEAGTAEASFTLSETGEIREIVVQTATGPEFGAALVAAMETWRLRPAVKGGRPTTIKLGVVHQFKPPGPDTPDGRLVEAWHDEKSGINSRVKLDRPLKPLWRVPPVYPAALRELRPTGEATAEFIIDRDGRARLPAVKSATNEAFGWAAATALSQWVFEPPLRQGQPTEVRVSIPFNFVPPAN